MIGVPEILEDPKFIAAYEIKGEPSWSKTLNEKKQSTDIFFRTRRQWAVCDRRNDFHCCERRYRYFSNFKFL